jgi:hypothetical protein
MESRKEKLELSLQEEKEIVEDSRRRLTVLRGKRFLFTHQQQQ